MECFVIGIVATGFLIRSVVKASQSWDVLARNLGYKQTNPFRLEGRHHGRKVTLERIPGKTKGSFTTELRVETQEGWPSELIIHSQAPRSGLLPFVPSGTLQKVDIAIFALRYVVLNVPIPKEVSNRILSLPRSDLFYASKDEFRFVFSNRSHPSPVEVRKILFQFRAIMKKMKSKEASPKKKKLSKSKQTPFVDFSYNNLVDTKKTKPEKRKPLLEEVQDISQNESLLEIEETIEQSYSIEESEQPSLESDINNQVTFVPVEVKAPTSQEESEFLVFYKSLGEFAMTSHDRES